MKKYKEIGFNLLKTFNFHTSDMKEKNQINIRKITWITTDAVTH